MTEKKKQSQECLAFQKNYQVLLNLSDGIETVSSKAFAAGLICSDLRSKCSNKAISESDRTKSFLEALEKKMVHVPGTLQDLVKILNETNSFEYIATILLNSLQEEPSTQQYTYTTPHAATLPGKSHLIATQREASTMAMTTSLGRLNLSSSSVLPFVTHGEGGTTPTQRPTRRPPFERR